MKIKNQKIFKVISNDNDSVRVGTSKHLELLRRQRLTMIAVDCYGVVLRTAD